MFELARASKAAWRLSAVLMMGATLSACSSVPDWVNPGTWIGSSDSQTASTDTQATGDQGAAGAPASSGQTVAEASDQYPALADTPDKAPPATSTDEQKQVAGALVADRTQAQYSAEALRGGTEAAAAPPGAAPAESALPPPPASTATASASPGDPGGTDTNANPDAAPAQTASAAPSGSAAMPGTLPSQAPAPAAAPPDARMASTASASSTGPAAAAVPARAQIAPTDAALGFQPSHAPPLDPQVAALLPPGSSHARQRQMAAISPTPARGAAVSAPAGAPTAVVSFGQDAATLDEAARAQVRAALEAYRAAGGQGYVRVVGHAASSGSTEQQMVSAVSRSQACADAVARELIKQGVPASRVLVDAVGDSGGDAGRRAEIFLQS